MENLMVVLGIFLLIGYLNTIFWLMLGYLNNDSFEINIGMAFLVVTFIVFVLAWGVLIIDVIIAR